jgi:hypothetical protein
MSSFPQNITSTTGGDYTIFMFINEFSIMLVMISKNFKKSMRSPARMKLLYGLSAFEIKIPHKRFSLDIFC